MQNTVLSLLDLSLITWGGGGIETHAMNTMQENTRAAMELGCTATEYWPAPALIGQ